MARTVNPDQYARRRSRILAAAAEAFAELGFDGASTGEICRRAGIGSGTLFHYFPTKAAVLRAIFADDLPRLRELGRRAQAEPDPATATAQVLEHLIDEVGDPLAPGLAITAVQQAMRDPELAAVLAELDRATQEVLSAQLRRWGESSPGRAAFPPDTAARWVRTLVDAAHLGLHDAPTDDRELRTIIGWLTGCELTGCELPGCDPRLPAGP